MSEVTGSRIGCANGEMVVPGGPVVPTTAGDGVAPNVSSSVRRAVDAVVAHT